MSKWNYYWMWKENEGEIVKMYEDGEIFYFGIEIPDSIKEKTKQGYSFRVVKTKPPWEY